MEKLTIITITKFININLHHSTIKKANDLKDVVYSTEELAVTESFKAN